jgi:hypothetical protein
LTTPAYWKFESSPLQRGVQCEPDFLDAIAVRDGRVSVVVDWKSDVAPSAEDIRAHAGQIRHYMAAVDAARGALVYMTSGTVQWVEAE